MSDFDRQWFGMPEREGFHLDVTTDIHTGPATVLVCRWCRPERRVATWDVSVGLVSVMAAAVAHKGEAHGEGS
jgi:hypothetical protein